MVHPRRTKDSKPDISHITYNPHIHHPHNFAPKFQDLFRSPNLTAEHTTSSTTQTEFAKLEYLCYSGCYTGQQASIPTKHETEHCNDFQH